MKNMRFFPFFLECSKYYQNEPLKQKLLHQLTFGQGGFMILKDKILITPEGEFKIPSVYSSEAHKELDEKLWKKDEYTVMCSDIKETLNSWANINKKNRSYLLNKFCSENFNSEERVKKYGLLIIANIMKMIKNNDIVYEVFAILDVAQPLLEKETYDKILFVYNYYSALSKSAEDTESLSNP
jgi:hypothetical protein